MVYQRYSFKFDEKHLLMKNIRLVLVDPSKNVRPAHIKSTIPSRPVISEPGEAYRALDLLDLIQAEMNEGYSIGTLRSGEGRIDFEDVYSDGTSVRFEPCPRPLDWIPAERLRAFIPASGPRKEHGYLEALACRKGYRVELIDPQAPLTG